MICQICNHDFDNARSLASHLQTAHRLDSLSYTIKYLHGGTRPRCLACDNETRYVSFTFKEYCKEHSRLAASKAGRIGGRIKRTWNKGQTKHTNETIAKQALDASGEGNAFFGRKHDVSSIDSIRRSKRLKFDDVIARIKTTNPSITLLSTSDEYTHRQNCLLRLRCEDCGTIDHASLFNLDRRWRCHTCFPSGSKAEIEIADFIRSRGFEVITNDRTMIAPLELDIFVPKAMLAIEHNGLYWHSGGSNSSNVQLGRHRRKHVMCNEAKIKLVQFFSDEWQDRRIQCEQLIVRSLGQASLIDANDCKIDERQDVTVDLFVERHSIENFRGRTFVLSHDEKIVCCFVAVDDTIIDIVHADNVRVLNVVDAVVNVTKFNVMLDLRLHDVDDITSLTRKDDVENKWSIVDGQRVTFDATIKRLVDGCGFAIFN